MLAAKPEERDIPSVMANGGLSSVEIRVLTNSGALTTCWRCKDRALGKLPISQTQVPTYLRIRATSAFHLDFWMLVTSISHRYSNTAWRTGMSQISRMT